MEATVVRRPWATQPNALPKPSALATYMQARTLLLPTSAGWADATGNLYRTGGIGTVITVATPDGLARTSSASIAWSDFLLDRGTLNPSDGYAWVMRGTLNSVLGSWGGIIARTANNATGQGWAWQRTNVDVLTVYHNAAAFSNSGTLSQFVDGESHTFVGVWRKSAAVLELWVDGVLRWSQTGANAAPLYTAGQGQLKILSSRDTPNINGKVAMVGVFNRSLSQGEAWALSLRPWQLFRARRRVLYFDAGGGQTVYNQNLSAISDATQAVLESRLSMARILSATGLSVLSLDKNISSTKLASSTHSGVIAKRSNVSKSTSSTSSSEMFRASSVSRALSAIANNLATLTRTATQSKALSSVSSAATSVVKGVRKTANASSTALATFVRTLTKSMYTAASNLASIASQPLAGLQYRTITAASTSVSYIVKSIRSVKLVQSTSDATISSLKSFYRIFSATSTSALTLSKGLQSRLSVIASSTATMIRESGQSVTMLAQSIGAATIRRLNVIQKAVISSSTSSINRAISAYRSLTTSSVGLGVINKLRYRTESVTSAAIASVTAVYTSVTSQIRVIIDKTSNFVRIKSITSLFTRSKDKDARF